MDRLFLDANILFSAAYLPDAKLLAFWKLKDVVLCSSRYALEEARINLKEEIQRRKLAGLARSLQFFEAAGRELQGDIELPDKDKPILQAALSARATHLITGDAKHFGRYFNRTVQGIVVLKPAQYLKNVSKEKPKLQRGGVE